MAEPQKRRTRNVADKRARIIAAAQVLFTEKGYSQTSVKAIAERSEVAAGLVIRHFESKLKLFEIALIEALAASPVGSSDRDGFARQVAGVVLSDEAQVVFPAMIMLSLEDEDARRVAMEVVREHVIKPTAQWLGEPLAQQRAVYVIVLSLGLALLGRLFAGELKADLDAPPVKWIIDQIQGAVSQGE